MATIPERLEAATEKAEQASDIMHRFANDAAGIYIPTESGQIPSMAEWLQLNSMALGQMGALQLAVAGLEDEITSLNDFRDALADPVNGVSLTGYAGGTLKEYLDRFVLLFPKSGDRTDELIGLKANAMSAGKQILLLGGTYQYDETLNWGSAASGLAINCLGDVVLKHLGAGLAFSLDAGSGGQNINGIRIQGRLVIEGGPSTTDGVLIRAIHHSQLPLNVRNVPGVAFTINYGVLTNYDLTTSDALGGTVAVKPRKGVLIDKRNIGEYVADCWMNLKVEYCAGIGVDIVEMQGSSIKGTSEHQTTGVDAVNDPGLGLRIGANVQYVDFDKFWMEGNSGGDAQVAGRNIQFINSRAQSTAVTNNIELLPAAKSIEFRNGYLRCINRQAGSTSGYENVFTSDNASLGLKGPGSVTKLINVQKINTSDVVTGGYTDILPGMNGSVTYDPPSLADGAGVSTTVTVTGARLGDLATASFSLNTQGITVTANVTANDTVTVRFQNETGGVLDLASGTLRVKVFQ